MKERGWEGLTGAQAVELDAALWLPQRRTMTREDAALDVADEYARRCAAMLCANDLRGALNAAEIWAAAHNTAERARPLPASSRLAYLAQRAR